MNYVANQWEDGEKLDLEKYRNIEQGIANVDIEKENLENKITFIDENSTDIEYPSARAVWLRYRQIIGFPESFPINWFDSDKETLLYANTGLYGSWPVYDNPEEPDVSANDFLKFDGSPIEIVSRAMDYRKIIYYWMSYGENIPFPDIVFPDITFPDVAWDYTALQSGTIIYPERVYGRPEYMNAAAVGSSAFRHCSSLSAVNFPACTEIGIEAFCDCFYLSAVNFPVCTTIGSSAFRHCSSLSAVNFPACTTIENIAFNSCPLSAVNFPACMEIGNGVFARCYSLSTVNFPACATIGTGAFNACHSLFAVNFPACTTIGSGAFVVCDSLSAVNFPVCTTIGSWAFLSCYALSSVNFSACMEIGIEAFYDCFYLSEIYLGSYYSDGLVVSLGTSAFSNTMITSSTGSIYVPESLVDIYKSAEGWSYYSNRIFPYTSFIKVPETLVSEYEASGYHIIEIAE